MENEGDIDIEGVRDGNIDDIELQIRESRRVSAEGVLAEEPSADRDPDHDHALDHDLEIQEIQGLDQELELDLARDHGHLHVNYLRKKRRHPLNKHSRKRWNI